MLSITNDGSSVRYFKNGTVIYTSLIAPSSSYYFQAAAFNVSNLSVLASSAGLKSVTFGPMGPAGISNWTPIFAGSPPPTYDGATSSFSRVSGTTGYTQQVYSKESYRTAYVSGSKTTTGNNVIFGLSSSPTSGTPYDSVTFGWLLEGQDGYASLRSQSDKAGTHRSFEMIK